MKAFNRLSPTLKVALLSGGFFGLVLCYLGGLFVLNLASPVRPTLVALVTELPAIVPGVTAAGSDGSTNPASPTIQAQTISEAGPTASNQVSSEPDLVLTYAAQTVQAQLTESAGSSQPKLTPLNETPTPQVTEPMAATEAVFLPGDHRLGEPWEQDGVSLNLIHIEIRAGEGGESAAARVWFSIINKTGQQILVEWNSADLYLEDSFGNRYVDWEGNTSDAYWVESGQRRDFNRYYSKIPKERSRIPPDAEYVLVIADRYSRIESARWRIDINPIQTPKPSPSDESVNSLGEPWERDGLGFSLTNIDIRVGEGGDSAAIRAWFEVTNNRGERVLVELDFAYLYFEDSYGNRFIDWEGGGYDPIWIDPGETIEFNRYYSSSYHQRSRIATGSEYVVLTLRRLASIENAQWLIKIIR